MKDMRFPIPPSGLRPMAWLPLILLLVLPAISAAQFDPAVLHPFVHGVASGDPGSDRVIIWTRISGRSTPATVSWSMAPDTSFATIVASGTATTDSSRDYTVKVDVSGLQPDSWYYYRFEFEGRKSLTGRTRTLPAGANTHLRLAVASCARVNSGAFYNSYHAIATRNDLQGVIHLGDYIYETQGSVTGRGVQILPTGTAYTLTGYRQRYNTYRLDQDLIRVHQQYPFFHSWDDHETANDSWTGGAEAHDSTTQGPWAARKAAGQQAFFEWLPIRPHPTDTFRSYRAFRIGDLAELIMLDTRLEGRDLQADLLDQTAYADTNRTLLGTTQMQWLRDRLSNSGSKWKILGNQVMFAPLQLVGIAFSYDQWDGYQADRNRIIDHVMDDSISNVVLVTGDIHTSWACDIPIPGGGYDPGSGAGSAFVEFIGPSITTGSDVNAPVSVIQFINQHIKYVNLTEDGYFTLDLDSARAQADWYHVSSIFDTNYTVSQAASWKVLCDERHVRQAGSPATGMPNQVPFAPLYVDNEPIIGLESPRFNPDFLLRDVYPNPFRDRLHLTVDLGKARTYGFSLMNQEGRTVYGSSLSLVRGRQTVVLEPPRDLPAASYWLLVRDQKGSEVVGKVLVVKH